MALSPDVVIRLAFVKYLVGRGLAERAKATGVSLAVAVLHFHDAAEIFLQCVAEAVGVPDSGSIPLDQYDGRIKKVSGESLHCGATLARLNDLRRPLKHRAVWPGRQAVADVSSQIEDFFRRNALEYLGVNFADLSLADLIVDATAREHVKNAEAAAEGDDISKGLKYLKVAFLHLLHETASQGAPEVLRRQMRIDRELIDLSSAPRLEDHKQDERLQRMLRQMNETYDQLARPLRVLQLGVDLADYNRFSYLTPFIQGHIGGEWRSTTTYHSVVSHTRESWAFCLNFVIETALKIQDLAPIRDPSSRYTIEVEAESVPVWEWSEGGGLVEERKASKGERFELVRITQPMLPDVGELWMIGEMPGARFMPFEGTQVVAEHKR